MREFKSLHAQELPADFDAEIHGEEPIVQVEESAGRIVVSYTFPGFYISDDSRDVDGEEIAFTQVNIAAAGFFARSGKPLLPSFGRYVQIPFNVDYQIGVQKGDPVEFEDVLLLPAQELLTDGPEQEEVKFEYDQDLYAQDVLYPEEIVHVSGPFVIDGYNSLLLHVTPLQYNPAQKVLTGYGNVTVTIEITPGDEADADEARQAASPEVTLEAFGNLFVNPRRGVAGRLETGPTGIPPLPFLLGPEFLIIYHDTFARAAQMLAAWKQHRGLRTETVSISTVGNSVGQIKAHIRGKRGLRSRLRYVLLFGDVDMIASETIPGGPFGSNVTDYYYSTPRDAGVDELVMPWLSIGRIPVRTADQGVAVVRQIIRYERNPPAASDYYKRMIFAGYFQDNDHNGRADRGYMQTMESIRRHMITLGFDVERVYVGTPGAPPPQYYIDGTPVAPDAAAALVDPVTATDRLVAGTTEGHLLAAHRDHGDKPGWSHPAFTLPHLDAITGNKPTVFYSLNCLTGMFDIASGSECFAEKLLRIERGAPSLIAATRLSHTWLNNDLMKGIFDATWGGVLPTFPSTTASYPIRHNRLGDILNYGKAYLPLSTSGSPDVIKDHFEIYHVVGDPTLELWRASPRHITLSAWIDAGSLHVKLARVPADAILTVWQGAKLLRQLAPRSTYLKLKLPWEATRHRLTVCCWAPGYRFRQVVPRRILREDCIPFDYAQAQVQKVNGRWKIVVGSMWLKDFGGNEAEARQALRVLRHYRMNRQCFVGRPDPSMEYYLVDGAAPAGSMPGEDCVGFDPDRIAVKQVSGRWKIVEGSHWILDFGGNEVEARTAFEIIKKYAFRTICFVGRPDPSMTYYRR